MTLVLNFADTNYVTMPNSSEFSQEIPPTLFGGILIDTQPNPSGDANVEYGDHFDIVADYSALNLVRYPDGELPDGFAHQVNGIWEFDHNDFNNGSNPNPFDPTTSFDGAITQTFLDALSNYAAFSLSYPDLLHPGLISEGHVGFSESLKKAIISNCSYSMVLPEFQYLKAPVNRNTDDDTDLEIPFVASDHVHYGALKSDVEGFLENLFLNAIYNDGNLPSEFILEIGNEDFFGWNSNFATPDSPNDFDTYSAYAMACLEAVHAFRDSHPNVSFKVAIQVGGPVWIDALEENFQIMNKKFLFAEVDIVKAIHHGLSVELDDINEIEHSWVINQSYAKMLSLIASVGGDPDAIEHFMPAWSALSGNTGNHDLIAAGATLSLFSGLFEMGFDYAANWGIGSWIGNGTNSSTVENGQISYAPYFEAYRLMSESLIGTFQIETSLMDEGSTSTYAAYAFEDDAKGVIFLSANGAEVVGQRIEFSNFGAVSHVWVERITDTGTIRENIDFSNGYLEISLSAFEVVRIIVAKADPGTGYLHLWGNETQDTLVGGNSDDLIEGNMGNDILFGGHGNDSLFGGDGDDRVNGGDGADIVQGGVGENLLTGGSGADEFIFASLTAHDIITDFEAGIDKIDLTSLTMLAEFFSFSLNGSFVGLSKCFAYNEIGTVKFDAVQNGADTEIALFYDGQIKQGQSVKPFIVLENVDAATLSYSDFLF